jgi:hypothetical protein
MHTIGVNCERLNIIVDKLIIARVGNIDEWH